MGSGSSPVRASGHSRSSVRVFDRPLLRALPVALGFLVVACASAPPSGLLGAYRFDDGGLVSIRRSPEHTLRYREFETGRSGRLYRETSGRYVSGEGFVGRDPVELVVEFVADDVGTARELRWNQDGTIRVARRVGIEERVEFESDGTRLVGRLHLPEGPEPHPALVLVHGSGDSPGSEWFYNGDFLVAHGVAVLAYDKRGSGRSGGDFTFDFHQLARDVVAAVDFLATRPDIRSDAIGLSGYSQGGWVAPLAASMTRRVRCVLVSYGMIESPAEEARLEMLHLVREGGADESNLEQADRLVRAAVKVVASGFQEGWDELNALDDEFDGAPWRESLDGTPVDRVTKYPNWIIRWIGPSQAPKGLPWDYDSTDLLESTDVPMAWFLGSEDESAPNRQTITKLRAWEAAGRPVQLTVFEGADHGMLVFHEEDGRRVYTGYAPGYFSAEVDAARRLLAP